MSRFRFELNLSSMAVCHDTIADDQPKAGPLPDTFGREERLKEVRPNIFWDTRSVIVDLHEELMILAPCENSYVSSSVDRIGRVVDEIGPHLIQFVAVRGNRRKRAIVLSFQRDAFQFVGQHGEGALDPFMDIDILQGGAAFV